MKNLDPLIRREYKRLGMNIVPDDALADLIFAKVQHERLRNFSIALVVLASIVIGLFAGWKLTDNPSSSSGIKVSSSDSLSFTQEATGGDMLPLPQAGYHDIDVSNPDRARLEFTFELQSGWIIQEITANPDRSLDPAGKIEVFEVIDGQEKLAQEYMMSSGPQINEFGVPNTGIFKFVLTFTNSNFKGRVRVAFVRSA